MDMSELKELIELFESSAVTEMDYERGDLRVRLKRNPAGDVVMLQDGAARSGVDASRVVTQVVQQPAELASSTGAEKTAAEDNLMTIDAPFVGIFYVGSAPDADAYVKLGQEIEEGQTVAIISAMKVMNEIKSEVAGVIREILVENGQAVEFGQTLFKVEPAPDEMEE